MKKICLWIGMFVSVLVVSPLQAQSFEEAMKVVERPVRKTDDGEKEKAPVPRPVSEVSRPDTPRVQSETAGSIQSPHPDFVVKLLSCQRVDDVALIKFTVTNVGKDIKISFYPYKGEAFDNAGNTYPVHCQLKNEVVDYAITQLLPTGISVGFTFRVDEIDAVADELLRLQVVCDAEGKSLLKNCVLFRSLKMKR